MQRDGETPDAEVPGRPVDGGDTRAQAGRTGEAGDAAQHDPEVQIPPAGTVPPPPPRAESGFFRGPKPDAPVLITEAAPSLEQQHRARVRRYMLLMGFRIPCLILAAGAYGLWHNALISLAIIGVSVPLPWIAVLVANDRPPRRKDEPSRWDGRRAEHKALESHHHHSIDG